MEILFPAGSLKHVDVAIRSGVDAVYGGFKKWNARDKADNFSFKQYKTVLDRLHENGIRFYLTLNTLLFDTEIAEILKLFKQHPEYLPDAFIATDIGLITELRKNFANVPVHLSTQFGIHNSDDMKLAEQLGVERVVLARELTKDTIRQICDNSHLETECFVYGSQCISFSGQCYFSSLLNGGSGNRGKCEIFCRDRYCTKHASGNLLYVTDMNCAGVIKDLPQVTSWKLEGRKRNPYQIGNYVNYMKAGELIHPQTGYMYGTSIEQNGLYSEKHTRAVPLIYAAPYDIAGNNISFNIHSSQGFIQDITYIDSCGEGHKFKRPVPACFIEFDPDSFSHTIEEQTGKNVYKITGSESIGTPLYIDKTTLEKITQSVTKTHAQNSSNHSKANEIWLETNDKNKLKGLMERYPTHTFVYDVGSIANLERCADLENDNIIYKLPMFNFENKNLQHLYRQFAGKRVMFTHIGQLSAFTDIPLRERLVDYTIPVWNKKTLQYLKGQGINTFTASPELSTKQNGKILAGENFNSISYGRLPLVFTRMCFRHLFGCKECSYNKTKTMKNIDKGIDFDVKCYPDFRIILASEPIHNTSTAGISRYVVNDLSIEQVFDLLSGKQPIAGYACNQNKKRR